MALTGASTVAQACMGGVSTDETNPKLDLDTILSPRLANMQAAITDMLGRIDQNEIVEYDDTLDSTLQSLESFYDSKVANSVATPTGSNVHVQSSQGVSLDFAAVLQEGVTVATPTDPGGAIGVTGGFVLTPQLAFTVETSAIYSGPIIACFSVPSIGDPLLFDALKVLHSEGSTGTLVDRTFSKDFATRTICGKTDTLSPFIVALKESGVPVIAGLPGSPCSLWPPNNSLVQVATVTASEQLFGLASFNVKVTSNELSDKGASDVVVTGSGLQPRSVFLRATRLGNGSGRTYTVTATATDLRGHSTEAQATCTVPHDRRR